MSRHKSRNMAAARRFALAFALTAIAGAAAYSQQAGLDLFATGSASDQRLKATARPSAAPLSLRAPQLEDALLESLPPARLVERARGGDPAAHYLLGLIYLAGERAPRDLVEAFAHIRIAAEAGHPRSVPLLFSLGARLTATEHVRAGDRAAVLRQQTRQD